MCPTESEKSDSNLSGTIENVISLPSKFVIPIYTNDKRGNPEQIGSGFIVKTGSGYVIISAAHVLRMAPERELFYYMDSDTIRSISGQRILGRVPEDQKDLLDVGGVLLNDEALPPYPGVDKYAVDKSYLKPEHLPRADKEYVIIGFPASRSKRNPVDKTVHVNAYAYHSPVASEGIYSALQLEPRKHLVLPFDRKRGFNSNGKQINLPKPQGMSGAPVWVLYENHDSGSRVFPLVGVGTTYWKNHKAMVATDIQVVVEMIDALGK